MQTTNQMMVDFLNSNFDRKIDLLKSVIKNFDGLKYSEICKLVRNVTKHFELSLARNLKEIPNRQKLVYRQSPNIIKRNNKISRFIIR